MKYSTLCSSQLYYRGHNLENSKITCLRNVVLYLILLSSQGSSHNDVGYPQTEAHTLERKTDRWSPHLKIIVLAKVKKIELRTVFRLSYPRS